MRRTALLLSAALTAETGGYLRYGYSDFIAYQELLGVLAAVVITANLALKKKAKANQEMSQKKAHSMPDPRPPPTRVPLPILTSRGGQS